LSLLNDLSKVSFDIDDGLNFFNFFDSDFFVDSSW